jgi:beta-lactamase superfamily II metal-dependent hydrolase
MTHPLTSRRIRPCLPLLAIAFAAVFAAGVAAEDRGLEIYWIDVEGGAATLIVTPAGESLLVDSGNPGERDLSRILKVARETARLDRIDHHIITHWHGDHFGSTAALAKALPIGRYYDHGATIEPGRFEEKFAWYLKLAEGKRSILKPGDAIPLAAAPGAAPLRLVCVSAHGQGLPGKDGKPQLADGCEKHPAKAEDKSDNAQSVGFKLSLGDFDFLDLGDLTWNIEHRLVCPENTLGAVDVYQTTHHGLAISNHPALVHAVAPRVAVMNNGPRKGGEPDVLATLRSSPGLEAVFQVHRNVRIAEAENAPAERIANRDEACSGDFVWLKVARDGKSYTVAAGAKGTPKRFESK